MEAVFTQEYFLDEVREGFYVPSIMKRVWAEQLVVLSNVDSVCKKLNIKWYAAWGTLLGAIRHKGYIPWDDDIDIFMFRDDYNKFFDYYQKNTNMPFHVKSVMNDRQMYSDLLRVNNTAGEALNAEYLQKHNGCFYGCGIDIFPIDIVDISEGKGEVLREKLRILTYLKSADLDNIKSVRKEKLAEAYEHGLSFNGGLPLYNACMHTWIELLDELAYKGDKAELFNGDSTNQSQYVAVLANGWSFSGTFYDIKWFSDVEWLQFENTEIAVPHSWDDVLKKHYGNYNIVVRGGANHSFPFFKKSQEKLWKDAPELKYTPKKTEICEKIICSPTTFESAEWERIKPGTVVFMPVSSSDWEYMCPIYEKLSTRYDVECAIVPIPYMLRNNDRSFSEILWDGDVFVEAGIPIVSFDKIDFNNLRPSAIVISDPYDSYNSGYSVYPYFYSSILKQYTDILVYVQCFSVDLKVMDAPNKWSCEYFIKQPGIANADILVLTDSDTEDAYDCIIREWKKSL